MSARALSASRKYRVLNTKKNRDLSIVYLCEKKIIAKGYPIFFFRLFPLLDKKYSISPLWTRILIYIYIYIFPENIISNWYRRNTVIFIATSSIIVKIDRLSTFSRSGVSFSVSKAKILARIYILYIFALHKLDTVVSQILFSPPSPLFLSSRSFPLRFDVVLHHRNERLHELHLGAIGADDVFAVGDETAADQRGLATRADETVVMPMPVLERDEASPANAWIIRNGNFRKVRNMEE